MPNSEKRAFKPIRWTLEAAASEFGINPRTLSARARAAELIPGQDSRFSTKEICRAVFGDIAGEKLRLVKEQADKTALENSQTRGELVSGVEMQLIVERGLTAMVEAVKSASNLEHEDKTKIINHLRQCGESVVKSASRSGNAAALHGEPVGGEVSVSEP